MNGLSAQLLILLLAGIATLVVGDSVIIFQVLVFFEPFRFGPVRPNRNGSKNPSIWKISSASPPSRVAWLALSKISSCVSKPVIGSPLL
jgi:hypothetical protein